MPRKIDPDATYGNKIIRLFAHLLFARRPYTLTELAELMNCSKQQVSRILREIEDSYQVVLDRDQKGKEAVFQVEKTPPPAAAYITPEDMTLLWMCRAFTERLVGKNLFGELEGILNKTQSLVKGEPPKSDFENFGCFIPGTIDYTHHQNTISTLIQGMKERKICKVLYKAAESSRAKTFHIKPLKMFCHKDALYLHAVRAKDPWQKGRPQFDFDPLLAVHRFKKVEVIENSVPNFPDKYDFESAFNRTFGIIKENTFRVEAEFTGWAAQYVAERLWSPDQVLTYCDNGVVLQFTAASEPEVISWILSFGEHAKVLGPKDLVDNIKGKVLELGKSYGV